MVVLRCLCAYVCADHDCNIEKQEELLETPRLLLWRGDDRQLIGSGMKDSQYLVDHVAAVVNWAVRIMRKTLALR